MNGYLEFTDPPERYTYPLVFPVRRWPKENDPSFIGIFFSKCRIGEIRPTDRDRREPGVYFRYNIKIKLTDEKNVNKILHQRLIEPLLNNSLRNF